MSGASGDRACLARARPAISARSGIIKSFHELLIEPDDASLFNCFTQVAATSRYAADTEDCYQQNGGAALTRDGARAAAIGETLERYSCSVYDRSQMLLATWRELRDRNLRALHPRDAPLYADDQYDLPGFVPERFTETTMLRWVPAWSLTKACETWIPAVFAYIPYYCEPPESLILYSVSTGLSCALDRESAVLSGLYESVERDAVMISWLNRLPRRRLDPASDAEVARVFAERFAGRGTEYMIFDFSTDLGVPVIFAAAVDRNHDQLALACGAAANFDVRRAAIKALTEAAQGRIWLKHMRQTGESYERPASFSEIRSFEDHVRLYGCREMLAKADFLIDQQELHPIPGCAERPPGPKAAIRRLVERLDQAGLEALVLDLTPPDVRSLGFHVVKTVVPGLQQLFADHNYRMLGAPRLYEVPARLGYRQGPTDPSEINPDPHPFP
ncbi:MAG TPA: YcaO-like family protein [Allosphingosinicella sp.]